LLLIRLLAEQNVNFTTLEGNMLCKNLASKGSKKLSPTRGKALSKGRMAAARSKKETTEVPENVFKITNLELFAEAHRERERSWYE
jgi:hypothetical protein